MKSEPGSRALWERAAAAGEASSALLTDLRGAMAQALGINVIDLRSNGADGTWVLVCSFDPPAASPPPRHDEPMTAAVSAHVAPEPPEPVFVSPMLGSRPFDGDGSSDLLRFIEEADPSVSVPPLAQRGELPPLLSDDERARLLASTIAGDVVLEVMHAGMANDPERLRSALDEGWDRYAAEMGRLGREPDAALYDAAAESAAAMIAEGI